MKKFTLPPVKNPSEIPTHSVLEEVLRDGAKRLLQEAIEYEVLEYVQKFKEMKDEISPVVHGINRWILSYANFSFLVIGLSDRLF
jgi:hypothetical protein